MKNTLALTALAIAIAAPSTALATDVKFGGAVQVKLNVADSADGFDPNLAAGDVRLNANASETVGGLTGFANVQLNMDALNPLGDPNGASFKTDGVHVGISGDFGTVKFGAVDDVNFGRYAGDILGEGIGNGQSFGYTNSFGAVNFGALYALEPDNNSDEALGAIGASTSFGAVSVGASFATDDRVLVGAEAGLGAVTLGAHYFQNGDADTVAVKASGSASVWSWGVTYATTSDVTSNLRLNLDTSVAGLGLGIELNQNSPEVGDSGNNASIKLSKGF